MFYSIISLGKYEHDENLNYETKTKILNNIATLNQHMQLLMNPNPDFYKYTLA